MVSEGIGARLLEHAELLTAPPGWQGAPLFIREFRLPSDRGGIRRATLAVTAQGIVEPFVDGVRVGADLLSPGWTAYARRLRVIEHDVTARLASGRTHEIALRAGNGWYCGRLGWFGEHHVYGDRPGAAAELRIEFADGSREVLATDAAWSLVASTVRSDDLYDGQVIDLTVSRGRPRPVLVEPLERTRLVRSQTPPIVRHESIPPRAIWRSPAGATLVDFGQNLVGWVRLRVRGPAGHVLRVRHAEILQEGELARRPLRSARAEDVYVLSGDWEVVEPTLTFHGFRFAQLDGWDGIEGSLEAVVVGSDLRRIGTFACSDPLLDRFHENVVWSLRGNTVGLPTDCPQRDERLGWTGDIAVFAPTACFLFDMGAFLRDWLADLRAEQEAAKGRVACFVPDPFPGWTVHPGQTPRPTAIWSDAAVWVPWALWEAYGDIEVLRESYASMAAHLAGVEERLSERGVWEGDFQFGDWLDPTAPADDPLAAIADPDAVATAAFHRSVDLTARTAALLGREDDAERWTALAAALRDGFAAAFATPDGRLASDAPAVYALAIVSGVLTPELTVLAGVRLAELVRGSGHRIIAGFAGAPYLCEALTRTGWLDDAHALMMNRDSPSWLAPLAQDATTIWERWDSLLPDGTVNPGEMTSFNHYALGAVADWMHRTIGGLVPLAPGWAAVRIDPRPPEGMSWARTAIDTPRGRVELSWSRRPDGRIEASLEAPPGVRVEWAPSLVRSTPGD